MKTNELRRTVQRIIIDAEELAEEPSLDSGSREEIEEIVASLKRMHPYSIDL